MKKKLIEYKPSPGSQVRCRRLSVCSPALWCGDWLRCSVVGGLVFFKAPDAEAFHSAFKEYSASLLNKDKRPSVLARLQELVQAVAELPGKVRHKEQERGL